MHRTFTLIISLALLCGCFGERNKIAVNDPRINSLEDLSIETLRAREYGSTIAIEYEVQGRPSPSYMVSYESDGLRIYARIDLPAGPVPANGFPVVMFVHGWMGIEAAPKFDFYYDGVSNYSQLIDAYREAGFAVLVPGWRGHGSINGRPADGIEFMQAWDNGSYLSPVFYAIDVLNLLDSLGTFSAAEFDLGNINLWGHSQGGDVALQVLAIAGENSAVRTGIQAASIWSGNIPPRTVQLETFWPMQTSPEAFLSGDGQWNGTATGADGSVNPNFVFAYPPDWIATVNPEEWTWQKDNWSNATVAEALQAKLEQMYAALNENVISLPDVKYQIETSDLGKVAIIHDPLMVESLAQIGGFHAEQFLTERLALHHSDRDFYSLPTWNSDLCERANRAGGECVDYTYPGNTHSLHVSEHGWFSPLGSQSGFFLAIQRDILLFSGKNLIEIQP